MLKIFFNPLGIGPKGITHSRPSMGSEYPLSGHHLFHSLKSSAIRFGDLLLQNFFQRSFSLFKLPKESYIAGSSAKKSLGHTVPI